MREVSLLEVLQEYHKRIRAVLSALEAVYGQITYDRVVGQETPAPGEIDSLTFAFHGTGCTARYEGYTLEWDWDEQDHLIFDPWKLWQMTTDHPSQFGQWSELQEIQKELERLATGNLLERSPNSDYQFRLPLS